MNEMDIARKITQLLYKFRRLGDLASEDKHDMKHRDIMMLTAIMYYKKSGELMKMSEISTAFQITPAAVSQCIKSFEKNDWIERIVLENDRRSVYIKVTPSAKEMIQRNEKDMTKRLVRFIEELGEDDAQALLRIMEKAADYFPKSCGKSPCRKGD